MDMKVENTTDAAMMEWVLHQYISDFIRDYEFVSENKLEEKLFNSEGPIEPVNPVDWTSINLKNVSPLTRHPNLGFLFSATGDVVNKMLERKDKTGTFTLHPDMPIVIKCLSAILDIDYEKSETAIAKLLDRDGKLAERQGRLAERQRRLAEKQRRLAERQKRLAAEREIERLRQQLMSQERTQTQAGRKKRTAARPATEDLEPASQVESGDSEPTPEAGDSEGATDVAVDVEMDGTRHVIKHPYLFKCNLEFHPVLVMRNMGASLHDLVYGAGSDFCARWRASPAMREAFREDVGLTALNLVVECELCHNDIRLPNIAFRDGRFCLLDFDMAREDMQLQQHSAFSPQMDAAFKWESKAERMMCYSVAQIAANVFVLDTPEGSVAGKGLAASSMWSTARDGSKLDAAFERWAISKGEPVPHFVSAVREACQPCAPGPLVGRRFTFPADRRGHFARVLRGMLA